MSNTTNNTQKTPRITKVMRMADIIAMLSGTEVENGTDVATAIEFLNHEIEIVNKKNKGGENGKAMTKLQKENEGYRAIVLDYVRNNPGQTCTAIYKALPVFSEAGYAPQKVSSLLRQLKLDGKVISEEGKGGKPIFRAVEGV